ncbi:MAG: heavy metal translocating P-type ATPase [Hyphomicrobiales bacterium]
MPAAEAGRAALAASAGASAVRCAHCGLPVPGSLATEPGRPAFCCAGCATVYEILNDRGLDAYYRMQERRLAPVQASGRGFEEFDHPSYHALYVRPRADGLLETDFYLEGVQCGSCVWLVERVPLLVDGMARAELDVRRSKVDVVWDGGRTSLAAIARTLDRLGYRPHPFRGARAEDRRRAEDRAAVIRLGVAGALALNAMLASIALYSGWAGGMDAETERLFRWLCLVLVTPAVLGPGLVFFRGAWGALRARSLHMDVPIAIAIAAGYGRGLWNTVTDTGPIYFDGVALLIFLLLIGRFLERRAQRAAGDAAELLHSLSPATASVVDAAGAHTVPVEALLPDMKVEVRSGETLPADGEIAEGRTSLDLSLLTGETRPVSAEPGARVFAGTVNRGARIVVRVTAAGETSRLGRILREAEAGAARRAPVVLLADRLAGRFVGAVLLVAAATLALWWRRDPAFALDQAIALLVVTCPCALALATPLAVSVAIGRAARDGILIRSGAALQSLAGRGVLFLDKTGTVTEGRTRLLAWEGDDEARRAVLALERHAGHPIARGFEEAWAGLDVPDASDVVHVPGAGWEGTVAGRRVLVGSPRWVRARAGEYADDPAPAADGRLVDSEPDPATPVLVAIDGRIAGRARFGDRVRDDAAASVATLRSAGFDPRLLSGDDPAAVRAAGAAIGVPPEACRGGASPETKRVLVESAARASTAVMVGDGVNDAAAIACATVGVGVSGGAEACLASADVFLARPGLTPLARLVAGSRRTMRVIRRNIAFSIVYNVVGASLAIGGVINPLIAAVLMPLSSLTVVLLSWKSRTFGAAS